MLAFLPTPRSVGNITNTKADLVLRERLWLSETVKAEVVIWRVPGALAGGIHSLKYRLALVADNVCALRYDNEAGKGDHKHVDDREITYRFIDLETLQTDFWTDVEAWRAKQ
jgi:hypothetical protein